jgi:hypothetical protein
MCRRLRFLLVCRRRSSTTTSRSRLPVFSMMARGGGRGCSAKCSTLSVYAWVWSSGKGNDKGKIKGLVGYARRNFLVPFPVFADFEALSVHLLTACQKRLADRLRGHDGTISARAMAQTIAHWLGFTPPRGRLLLRR